MTSHRQIFKSSAIIGGASVINIILSILKVKVLAVLLGPAGVGIVGLYQIIMSMASTLAGCGMGNSGVRQLAGSLGKEETLAIVRRALWLGNLVLGLAGMVILWLLREPIALWVIGDVAHVGEVAWLGMGVLLTLIASSQTALMQGLRRIGDLARVNVVSAFFGAIVGISMVYMLGQAGVVWFVLAAPASSALIASFYAARLPRPQNTQEWSTIYQQWQVMLKLGIPFMAASLLTIATQLAARLIFLHELGLDAVGHFQAAWAISMTYIGFVLSAMGADYYPRLTESISDHFRASKLVNEQTEMALLLAGPALLAMITLTPWVIHLLYATSFDPATNVLRWQLLGDVVKVVSWPMGFIMLASGRGGLFISTELIWSATYLLVLATGVQEWGLNIAGVGFFFAYLTYFAVVALVSVRLIGYKPERRSLVYMLLLLIAGALLICLADQAKELALVIGVTATLVFGIYSVHRLNKLMEVREWLGKRFGR